MGDFCLILPIYTNPLSLLKIAKPTLSVNLA